MDTGFSHADAENDFLRVRRRQVLSRLASWLRREPDDVSEILPFDEVVAALGRTGERRLGLQVIPLDSIVGSVDRTTDFDRWFRPRSQRTRERWERLARAQRRGEVIPPIDVYRVGGLHFVRDGHHRVSVAHAVGLRVIEARVTEVMTRLDAAGVEYRGDLITKDLRRVFLDRVPLTGPALDSIRVTDPWSHAELSETVEAWGFRLMQHERRYLDRETVARRWWSEEFQPVVRMLREAELIDGRTDAEAYLQLACQRYQLLRTHRWDDEVVARLRADPGRPH
ncbi:ParB N-terminal domain-containing protein [Pseudonocardia asaccharolytica]|uniref:Chromosome partitioning protein ParB n=1 Tax=Pseudonocardia asaccharolytica DSM 44247 = NBRC 16224 TaxID=1123024 RepID=A0A511DB44_9PSEU|nr:ParB N-terminal domain-containing protein [Pseudonocardia asaccharolytica]GEL20884.1 chromosome partitioning protein ParB [Pseudonocardia asaccharolytica DSM 44247 = NBRC 16224]